MSEENVERYRRSIQALNRRDPAAFLALMDVGVEAVPTVVSLEGDVRGHDGVRRWYASVLDVFPDFTIEVVTVRDLGDLTLAVVGFRGHGSGSDTPFEMTLWSAAEWRDGKCVWWGNYRTEPEALEAVGLREKAPWSGEGARGPAVEARVPTGRAIGPSGGARSA